MKKNEQLKLKQSIILPQIQKVSSHEHQYQFLALFVFYINQQFLSFQNQTSQQSLDQGINFLKRYLSSIRIKNFISERIFNLELIKSQDRTEYYRFQLLLVVQREYLLLDRLVKKSYENQLDHEILSKISVPPEKPIFQEDQLALFKEKVKVESRIVYDLWQKLDFFDFGPRPIILINQTTLKAIWEEQENYFYYGETSIENNSWHGKGIIFWKDSKTLIEGWWLDYSLQGRGRKIKSNRAIYIGDYLNGERHGYGIQIFPKGDMFKGVYQNDKQVGKGMMYFSNYSIEQGTFDIEKNQEVLKSDGIELQQDDDFLSEIDSDIIPKRQDEFVILREKSLFNHEQLDQFKSVVKMYSTKVFDLWQNLPEFDWGPRPTELIGNTSMVPFFDINKSLIYFGETSLLYKEMWHGKGMVFYKEKKQLLECWWKDHQISVRGREINENNEIYEGDFLNGQRHGKGILKLPNGTIYKGEFENNKLPIMGEIEFIDGEKREYKKLGNQSIQILDGGLDISNSHEKIETDNNNLIDQQLSNSQLNISNSLISQDSDNIFKQQILSSLSKIKVITEKVFLEKDSNQKLINQILSQKNNMIQKLYSYQKFGKEETQEALQLMTDLVLQQQQVIQEMSSEGNRQENKKSIVYKESFLQQLQQQFLDSDPEEELQQQIDNCWNLKIIGYNEQIENSIFSPDLLFYYHEKVKEICPILDKIWKNLGQFNWGPRPSYLMGETSLMSVFIDFQTYIYYGEVSILNNQLNHGRGIEFFLDTKIIYESWYVNNKPHGRGRRIDVEKGIYEGEWVNGQQHGQGTYISPEGLCYEGTFNCGKREGTAKIQFSDGLKIYGRYKDNLENGSFITQLNEQNIGQIIFEMGVLQKITKQINQDKSNQLIDQSSIFKSDQLTKFKEKIKAHSRNVYELWNQLPIFCWRPPSIDDKEYTSMEAAMIEDQNYYYYGQTLLEDDTIFHGKGIIFFKDTLQLFECQWIINQIQGTGRQITHQKEVYEGEFSNGERHGHGILTFSNGEKYKGEFSNNKFHGKGEIIAIDGSKREATFLNGEEQFFIKT